MLIARVVLGASLLLAVACAGSGASRPEAGAGRIDPEAKQYSGLGLTVSRPEGWLFIAPDKTTGADTVVLLQGPIGDAALAPVVELARRQLSAADQRRKPAHVLTALVTEIVQTFDGFQMQGEPTDLEIAGKPGARVQLRLQETLPEGAHEERNGTFYAVVDGDHMWLVRCLGPANGAADSAFEQIVKSLQL